MEQLKVTKQLSKVIVIVLLLISVHTSYPASSKPASVLLQEGLYAEEVEGNLDEAIKIYQEVITSSQQMEQSAAQATYRIALCYLKKGDTEQAAKQFSQLISKYPRQESLVKEAQKQLEKLSTPSFEEPVIVSIYNMIAPVSNYIDRALDLDNNKVMSIPDDKMQKDHSDNLKWLVDNGGDLVAVFQGNEIGLMGFNMISETLSSHAWDELSVEELLDKVKDKQVDPNKMQIMKFFYQDDQPVYTFATKNGSIGLLQILSFSESSKKIELKYKKLKREQPQKVVKEAVMTISTCAEGDPKVAASLNTLKNLNQNTVVKEIASFLDNKTANIRRSAIYILWRGNFTSIQPAEEKLLKLCTHEENLTRGMAALALGEKKVSSSFEVLKDMTLNDKDGYARRCAAYALGLYGDKEALPTLQKALEDSDPMVKANAQAAIALLNK